MRTYLSNPQRLPRWRRILFLAGLAFLAFDARSPRRLAASGPWVIQDHPTTRDLNKLCFLDNTRGWVVGDGGTILRTDDGGENWMTQTSPVSFDVVDIDMLDAQLGWAIAQQFPTDTTFDFDTTVIQTTDGGTTWAVQFVFDYQFLHAIEFTDATHGILGGDQGKLWRTTDGGSEWSLAVVDSPLTASWPIREVKFYSPMYGVATGGLYDVTGQVWRTLDGGQFWTHSAVSGEPLFAVHFFDSLNVLCVGGDLDYGAGMVTSTNGGAGWEYTYLGVWGQGSAVSFRTPTEGWAPLGFAGTVMYTLDSGRRWDALFTPDSTAMRDIVFTDGSTGYMVGDAGTILEYVGSVTAVGDPLPDRREQSLLLQNSPNPFHPKTQFGFRVMRSGPVSLKVYDVLGREVATIVDEALPPGDYVETFDGERLPSGVYYYRLATGGAVDTRQMVLLR